MANFVTKNISSVKGRQQFRQLIIVDERINIDTLQAEIDEMETNKEDNRIRGIFDIYEDELEKKYRSSLRGLVGIMNRVANLQPVSKEKFKDVTPSGSVVKEYEIKFQDLRAWAIKIPNGKLLLIAGYKNNQQEGFNRFRSLKAQYLQQLEKNRK